MEHRREERDVIFVSYLKTNYLVLPQNDLLLLYVLCLYTHLTDQDKPLQTVLKHLSERYNTKHNTNLIV